jgi:non-heme chloroperoxidase
MGVRVFLLATVLPVALLSATESAWGQAEPRSRSFLTSDGVALHYLEAGSGPTLVFVPGWTMPAEIWEPQLRHFATTNHVVAFDPRGHGRSDKPTFGYHPSRRALDIWELLLHLDGKPAVVIGWSLGVQEVLLSAQEFGTDLIRAVVLVDHDLTLDAQETRELVAARVESLLLDRPGFTRAFVEAIHASPQPAAYLEGLTEAVLAMPTTAAALVSANVALLGPIDLRPALQTVDRPVLFVFSSLDWAVAAAEKVRREWPGIPLETMDATSHALFVDRPEEFNRVLEAFLASLPD